jgi:hypothetical protein
MTRGHWLMSVKALQNTTFYVGLWADCLKDYNDAVKLFSPPSLYGDRSAICHDWEGERANQAFVLSLGAGECHSMSSRFGVWFTNRFEEQLLILPWSCTDGHVMYGYEILFSFGDFEFSSDLCSFGIPDRLSSECFGVHRWCGKGVGKRGRLSDSGYLGLFLCLFFV